MYYEIKIVALVSMFLFTLYFVFETYFLSPSRTTTPFWTLFSLRCSVSSTRTSFKSSWRTFPSFSHLIPRGSNHVLYYAVALLGPFVSHDHLLEMRNYLSKVREELNNKEAANPVNSFVCLKHLLFYKSLSCDPNRSCICCSFQSDTSLARLLCRLSAASFSTVDKLDSDVFTLIDRSRSEFSTRMALPRASLSSSGRSTASLFSEMEREKGSGNSGASSAGFRCGSLKNMPPRGLEPGAEAGSKGRVEVVSVFVLTDHLGSECSKGSERSTCSKRSEL